MSLEVRYIDIPDGAQSAATITGENAQRFSDTEILKSRSMDIPWATLENGEWLLDGSRKLIPDDLKSRESGWWSAEVSGGDGYFSDPPALDFVLDASYSATGLSFVFSPSTDQWCSEIHVEWYRGNAFLHQTTAFPDSAVWTLDHTLEGFDRVRIEFLRTNIPGQFAKVQMLVIGQIIVFGEDELVEVRHLTECDHRFSELPINTMHVHVQDRKGRNLAPQQNQRMELIRNDQTIAVQYISEGRRESAGSYSFECQSVIGLLADDYMGGILRNIPLETLLDDILEERSYAVDPKFAGKLISGYLPVCTRREALQQVAFAVGALVMTHGGDAIRLVEPPKIVSCVFSRDKVFPGASMEVSPRVSKVSVTGHSYSKSAESVTLMSNDPLVGLNELITFDEPYYDYAISGGEILASGDNWVRIFAGGDVTLTAKKYNHITFTRTKINPKASPSDRGNVVSVDNVALITNDNADEILDRLFEASTSRHTLTQEAIIEGQKVGMMTTSVNPWGNQTKGVIVSMDSTYTQNGHVASMVIAGDDAGPYTAMFYSGQLYAGEEGALY